MLLTFLSSVPWFATKYFGHPKIRSNLLGTEPNKPSVSCLPGLGLVYYQTILSESDDKSQLTGQK